MYNKQKTNPWVIVMKNNQFFFSLGVISLCRKMTPGHNSAGVIILLYTGNLILKVLFIYVKFIQMTYRICWKVSPLYNNGLGHSLGYKYWISLNFVNHWAKQFPSFTLIALQKSLNIFFQKLYNIPHFVTMG